MINYWNYKSKKGGFSLIEILVTIAIIGTIIVMYNNVFNTTFLAQNVKNKDLALKIASNKMEELRALGYSNLPTSGSFSDFLLSSLPSGVAAISVSNYNSGIKQVSVTVSWTGSSGGQSSVVLETLLAQTGGF